MDVTTIQNWIAQNPYPALGGAVLLIVIVYLLARLIFGRGLTSLARHTKNKSDDIITAGIRPYRAAWLAPFIVLYSFAYLAPAYQDVIQQVALFFILWISALTLNGLLDALNQIYESSTSFRGVSIQGYLDIVKILVLMVGVILSVSLITGESPLLLLGGLGALTAVLLFVFHDTILSVIASVQITTNDLIKEGDWVEVPEYDADGDVLNISLYNVKIQNWDKTISVIPTYKMVDVAYKNWRGMQESGGRRIKRAIHIDQTSIKFCDSKMLSRYQKIDLTTDYITERRKNIERYQHGNDSRMDSPLDGPQVTNVEVFRAYLEAYLRNHPGIHTDGLDFLVRELDPSPTGLPIEIYVFTKTTAWLEYERIQAEIFDHLLATAGFFDLRVFQEPSGSDFARALHNA